MNVPPVPKPRATAPNKLANELSKKPIPLPRLKTLPVTYENPSKPEPVYKNADGSTSSNSSSVGDDTVVNTLDVTDDHYYATILERPEPPFKASSIEKRDKTRNGFDKSRELIRTLSSDLQERRKNVVGTIEKSKKSARDCLERATKQAKDQLSRRVHKRFTSFVRETSSGNVYNAPSSFNDDRPSSMPARSEAKVIDNEKAGFNPALSSKVEDLSRIPDDVARSYSPPPPEYPPPPLPDDSNYDVPSSTNSSRFNTLSTRESSSSSYRSSFSGLASLYDEPKSSRSLNVTTDTISLRSDLDDISDSDFNDFSTFPRGKQTMRADSWSYYDSLSKRSSAPSSPEPLYSNDVNEHVIDSMYDTCQDSVDSSTNNTTEEPLTPTASPNIDRFSDLSHVTENSLYENCEISLPSKTSHPVMRPKHSNSLIREFDPLAVSSFIEASTPATNDLMLLESLLEGDTYGTLNRNQESLAQSQEADIEEDYPSSDEDNTNVIYGLEPVSEEVQTGTKSPVIKVTNVQHELLPELPQKIKNRDNDLSKASSSTASSDASFPLSPKINLSAAQYESLADSLSDPMGLLHASSDVMLCRPILEEKEEKSGVSKNLVRFSNLWRRTSFKNKDVGKISECITKPPLNGVHVSHKGKLYKCTDLFFTTKQENLQPRYCKIEDGKLLCHVDVTMTIVKEVIPMENLMSVQIVHNHKLSMDGNDLHCFELNMQTTKARLSYLFALNTSIERNQWAQKLIEVMTNFFPAKHIVDFTRAGWCFIKNGISSKWASTWILLRHRTLIYQDPCEKTLQTVDLRKARCISLQEADESCKDMVCEGGPVALVDSPQYCLYLRMGTIRETKVWRHEIHSAATRNGPALHQQQLTKDNIPTLVDKCLNFVYTHGSLSEGIYRRSGSSVVMNKLLTSFRVDAWKVQLSPQEFTEHDVAGTIKRFFRDLPEPLLTVKLSPYFLKASGKKEPHEKLASYKRYISMLPIINAATLKKLVGHLNFIQSQRDKNLMTVDNLSAIWGPTLLKSQCGLSDYSTVEYNVIVDLITLYRQLYELTEEDLNKESLMLTVLMRYHSAANSIAPIKPSGDIKMWIQLDNATKDCVPVSVTPQMSANDICYAMSSKMGLNGHELIVEENVLQGQLKRPMHFSESILETVLRWGYWNDEDRKDNLLIVKKDNFFREVAPFACAPCTMSGELKFADTKSKSFRLQTFDFNQAKLSYYKDKSGATRICDWKIEEIVWYLGFEAKRNPQSLWAVTFVPKINKPKRSKENPFFGHTIAGSSSRDMLKWLGVMLCSEYPRGVIAPARLVLE